MREIFRDQKETHSSHNETLWFGFESSTALSRQKSRSDSFWRELRNVLESFRELFQYGSAYTLQRSLSFLDPTSQGVERPSRVEKGVQSAVILYPK
jgi:hypothetical protein